MLQSPFSSFQPEYKIIAETQKKLGVHKIGTEVYAPLEVLLKVQKQGFEVDMWSAGVILLQFLSRKYTFFHSLKLMRRVQEEHQKNRFLVSFIMELAVIFGKEKIEKTLEKFSKTNSYIFKLKFI